MEGFGACRLVVECEAVEPLSWHPHRGSSLRGALYRSLVDLYCMNPPVLLKEGCPACHLLPVCPVALLVSTVDRAGERGEQVPRPYTIEPPLEAPADLGPGDRFAFGITLLGQAVALLPYVVLSLERMGRRGVGRRLPTPEGRRGRFAPVAVWSEDPFTGERALLWRRGEPRVRPLSLWVDHRRVLERAGRLPASGLLALEFRTPTRLVDRGTLVKEPRFRPFFQRLLERLSALARRFSETPLDLDFADLIARAEGVTLVEDRTRWVDLSSYSHRLGRATPIGGFVGRAVFRAESWRPFLPWLVWGEVTHVGKDAVKGNGWYRILEPEGVG